MGRPKTKEERLFSAAVLRASFELQEGRYREGFRFVYEGVLRDLGLEEREVEAYLAANREAVRKAMGRGAK